MLVHACSYLARFSGEYLSPNHNNQISGGQAALLFSKTLSKQTLQCIAFYRFVNLFSRNCESEARALAGIFTNQYRDSGIAASKIILENLLKFDCAR